MVGPSRNVDGMEVFENGILVGCDVRELAQAVEFLIKNPSQSRAMGLKGREFVAGRFSHLRLADDLGQLYQSLAKAKLHSKGSAILHTGEVEATLLSTDKTVI